MESERFQLTRFLLVLLVPPAAAAAKLIPFLKNTRNQTHVCKKYKIQNPRAISFIIHTYCMKNQNFIIYIYKCVWILSWWNKQDPSSSQKYEIMKHKKQKRNEAPCFQKTKTKTNQLGVLKLFETLTRLHLYGCVVGEAFFFSHTSLQFCFLLDFVAVVMLLNVPTN